MDLDIPEHEQVDLFDTLDADGGGTIELDEFVVGISKLRGDARRSDIVQVGLIARNIQLCLTRMEEKIDRSTKKMNTTIFTHAATDRNRKPTVGSGSVRFVRLSVLVPTRSCSKPVSVRSRSNEQSTDRLADR